MIDEPNRIQDEERREDPKPVDWDAYTDSQIEKPEQSLNETKKERSAENQAKVDAADPNGKYSAWEQKEAKDFGLGENLEDAGRAVVTGVQNVWNNTVDLGKYLDPKFYAQQQGEEEEYEFASDWKFNGQVMPKTRWGGFIRDLTDFGVGMVGVGKIGMGIKGVRGLMMAGKTVDKAGKVTNLAGKANLAKRLGADAVKGAVVDVWDTSMASQESYTEQFVKANPVLAENIFGLEDGRDLSPAQRAGLNVFESMGIGSVFGAALEGGGNLVRKFTEIPDNKVTKPTKDITKSLSQTDEVLKAQEKVEYNVKTATVEAAAKTKYEADTFKALKKSGAFADDVTIEDFRNLKTLPGDKVKWEQLDDLDRYGLMEKMAKSKNMDWGDMRDYSRYSTKQGTQALEIGADQLEADLAKGNPRPGAYYSADKTEYQNQPLSSGTDNLMGAVRDQIDIRTNIGSRRGTNRGVATTAQIHRMAEQSGVDVDFIKQNAIALTKNEEFTQLYKGKAKEEIIDDFIYAAYVLQEFLGPQGRLTEYTPQQLLDFIYAFGDDAADIYGQTKDFPGIRGLTTAQLQMTDVVLGQISKEMRDIARASFSVDGVVDSMVPGGMFDELATRYKALQVQRMRTTSIISGKLRDMQTGTKTARKTAQELAEEAATKAQQQVDLLVEVIRKDESGGLFDAFRYFTAASNGNLMTMADMADFFAHKFKGGMRGNKHERNKILGEMMTMGINSMLSGPKTPVRAVIGTGMNTVMRPAATIVGTVLPGTGNRRTRMAAWSELGGMLEGLSEAWSKAVADYKTFFDNGGDFRGYTKLSDVDEFDAIKGYYQSQGTAGEKALFNTYSMMRGLNTNPFLSYGPRIMKASDTFFGQLIYRGTKRAEAFREVYDRMMEAGGAMGDMEFKAAVREAEKRFNKKVWAGNGKLADDYANFKWKEAALTGEMPKWAQSIESATEQLPLIKPFVGLFMKTGINAVQLSTKYTPGLNLVLKEARDIQFGKLGDPELTKYGIKTADQLQEAKAVLKGRQAIGAGFIGLASSIYLGGNLSGNGPPDYKLRKAWEQSGKWQARSIKIGGKWVSYESLEPFNALLAYVADVGDLSAPMGEQWTEDMLARAAYMLSANVTNKTFMAGLMNLSDLLTGKGRSPDAIAANLLNNQIPLSSMRNEIGKLVNPGMRELEGNFVETIRNRNLWSDLLVSEDGKLPYRFDIFDGKPLNDWDPMTRMLNAVLPFKINTVGSQTRDLIMRSSVNLHQTFTTGPGGISLEGFPDVQSDFQFYLSQQNLEERFQKLFAKNPDIMASILDMERAHANGETQNPTNATLHGDQIRAVFEEAKAAAWAELREANSRVIELENAKALEELEIQARRSGDTSRAAELDEAQKILDVKY